VTPCEHENKRASRDRYGAGVPGDDYMLGSHQAAVEARLAEWVAQKAADRIWAKDSTFWSPTAVSELTDRLGWLRLPETMLPETEDITGFASEVRGQGYKHAVLLGMGGSSLAPEVYQAVFGNRHGFPHLLIMDSTHPDAVRAIEETIDPVATLFIVASKSGTTVESLSFFRYFYDKQAAGGNRPGLHFVAISDPGTPLMDLAAERGFRRVFAAVPDVGGRYSALSHFGLVPAALIGMDITDYLARAGVMAARCRLRGDGETNPGLVLGATLGELALAGRDKITFVTSPSLAAFPQWLEQLIAESTGKQGKGIVPVVDEPLARPASYGRDRVFACLSLRDELDRDIEGLLTRLASDGHPVLRFELPQKSDLAGEMFRWEMAVAAAGAVLGIHPFNQPDVQRSKSLAKQAMAEGGKDKTDGVDAVPVEAGERTAGALSKLLGTARPGDYLALQVYVSPSPDVGAVLQTIRTLLRDRFRVATTLGFGPRFLHSTGQLHKGGPDSGIFMQMVDRPRSDIKVPETDFTFGRLVSAQALGDYRALCRENRRVVRIDLGADTLNGLRTLERMVRKGG
jgi:transaldolase/glucose-6-phosphate isomerase